MFYILNLFFENMDDTLELLLLGLFFFALYWFIMRKYNSLGLRMFLLCASLFIACCIWIYKDEMTLRSTVKSGEEHIATVISKSKTGRDNAVNLSFTASDGKTINAITAEYVSIEEWENFLPGKPLSVIYVTGSGKTYVQKSIMRFKADKIYLYFFAGFWLLLGTMLFIWLRKIRVGVDENTGAEWLVLKDGSIIFDERKK